VAAYLDASALVKLVVVEPESEALRRFLRRRPERVSSALSRVEVVRAVRLHGPRATKRARQTLARVRLLILDDTVLDAAGDLDPRVLRSLDAIHLASAQALSGDLDQVVTYDRRMAEAGRLLGLSVRAPGATWDKPSRKRRAEGRRRRARQARAKA
jgi:uncharacterized protein